MGTAVVGEVANSGNVLIDSLAWGSRWVSEGTGPTVITVGYTPGASAGEIAAMKAVMANVAAVANVTFNWIGADANRNADVRFVVSNTGAAGVLGQGLPPGEFWLEPLWNPGLTEVRIFRNNYAGGLAPGGYDYVTYLHEFAHALGLAHPHDTGGTWLDKSLVFPGVTPGEGFGDLGDFNLNQGIFTTMSYNDGWVTGGVAGYQASMMALDIQALQWIYGANTTYATGNDSYALPNAKGGFTCIWDCGGTDSIIVTGRRGAVIDLRAATGTAAEGGGGFVSHVAGSRGGYTIAVGVVIENATGGNSNDTINGNAAGNVITGNGGRDIMTGGAGSDCFVFNSLGNTSTLQSAADVITDFMAGSDRIDVHTIDANATLKGVQDFSFLGEVAQFTAPGQVRVSYTPDQTLVLFNTDRDQQSEAVIVLTGHVSLTDSDFLF